MPKVPLQLGIQSNPGRHPAAGSARIYNCYMEPGGEEGTTQTPLYPVAGLTQWAAASSSGGVRAMLATANYLYVVRGRLLERFDSSGASTTIGGIPTDGPVFMARNRAEPEPEIGIVSGGSYWRATGTTLAENTDTDLPPTSSIDVLNGYFILPGFAGVWYISDVDDGSSIDPADFASAESLPDNIVRVATRETELVIFSSDSTEWWQDTGAAFPFARVQTARIGCLAARSVANVDRSLMWVAADHTVRLMEGYGGRIVSHPAVQRDIADETDKSGIVATAWHEAGAWFYSISGTAWTWELNVATGKWHQRKSYGAERWKCAHVCHFAGLTIAGDRSTGALYLMDRDTHTEGSDPLVMEVIAPAVKAFPNNVVVDRLALRVQTGTGLVPGSTSTAEPAIMVAMSRDGGATFGTDRHLSLGTRGNRTKTVASHSWGQAESAVFRLTCSAAVARGFYEASIDVTTVK